MEQLFGGEQHRASGNSHPRNGVLGGILDKGNAPPLVFPHNPELSNKRMKDLLRLVRLGKEDPQVYASKAHMRAVVGEVVSIQPAQLYQIMANALIESSDTMCTRGYNYVSERIEARRDIDAEIKVIYVEEVKRNWEEFAAFMRQNIEVQLPSLEQLIFDHVYTLDKNLFSSGYIRFKHQKGLDCTDLEGAKEVENAVASKEARLEAAYAKRIALIKKRQLIQRGRQETRELFEHIQSMKAVIESKVMPLKEQFEQLQLEKTQHKRIKKEEIKQEGIKQEGIKQEVVREESFEDEDEE